jgi:predicted dehydrogenase
VIIFEPKERYSAALIGAGRIGLLLESDAKRRKPATHAGMWAHHGRFDLAAVCDSEEGRFDAARAVAPNVACYTDAAEMLSAVKPDVVSIATWRDSHHAMMKLALDHGVPAIICEKPIAERREDAAEVVDEAARRGVHLLINHRRRFDPLLYPFRDDLAKGIIGDLLQVNAFYVYGLLTTATHLVDTLRMILGPIAGEVAWVTGHANPFATFHPDDDPNIDGFLGFESGLKAAVQSLSMKDYDNFDFHFYGRAGKAVFKNIGRTIEIFKVVPSQEHEGFTELADIPDEVRGGEPRDLFGAMADNVLDCLEGRATSLSTGDDSLKALDILLAMRRSAEDGGRPIRLD